MALSGTLSNSALMYVQGGLRLAIGSAISWTLVTKEVQRRHRWTPTLTDAYRPLAEQTRIFLERYQKTYTQYAPGKVDDRYWPGHGTYYRKRGYAAAAVPGTSNHGWGKAVDVADLGGFAGARFKDFADVATEYGWTNTEGASVGEWWHWVHVKDITPPRPPSGGGNNQEDDMTEVEFITLLSEAAARSTQNGRLVSNYLRGILTGISVVDDDTPEEISAAVWRATISRGGKNISVLQEVADANTRLIAAAAKPDIDVDEALIAKELAPLISKTVSGFTDADLARLATAAADEQDRRERARLGTK